MPTIYIVHDESFNTMEWLYIGRVIDKFKMYCLINSMPVPALKYDENHVFIEGDLSHIRVILKRYWTSQTEEMRFHVNQITYEEKRSSLVTFFALFCRMFPYHLKPSQKTREMFIPYHEKIDIFFGNEIHIASHIKAEV